MKSNSSPSEASEFFEFKLFLKFNEKRNDEIPEILQGAQGFEPKSVWPQTLARAIFPKSAKPPFLSKKSPIIFHLSCVKPIKKGGGWGWVGGNILTAQPPEQQCLHRLCNSVVVCAVSVWQMWCMCRVVLVDSLAGGQDAWSKAYQKIDEHFVPFRIGKS